MTFCDASPTAVQRPVSTLQSPSETYCFLPLHLSPVFPTTPSVTVATIKEVISNSGLLQCTPSLFIRLWSFVACPSAAGNPCGMASADYCLHLNCNGMLVVQDLSQARRCLPGNQRLQQRVQRHGDPQGKVRGGPGGCLPCMHTAWT